MITIATAEVFSWRRRWGGGGNRAGSFARSATVREGEPTLANKNDKVPTFGRAY